MIIGRDTLGTRHSAVRHKVEARVPALHVALVWPLSQRLRKATLTTISKRHAP